MGRIVSITPTTEFEGFSWVVGDAHDLLDDCHVGDSIAVNGCCLTVTEFDAQKGEFRMGLANETLDRTNLGELLLLLATQHHDWLLLIMLRTRLTGELGVGDLVNLERAMSGKSRFGGHIVQVRTHILLPQLVLLAEAAGPRVQGHVDTTARILSVTPDGDSMRYLFALSREFHTALIPKGYVALDGTSLTLTTLGDESDVKAQAQAAGVGKDEQVFGVMLIAHTQAHTVVARKQAGETVNVECDIVGKGLVRVVQGMLDGAAERSSGGGAGAGAATSGGGTVSALETMVENAVERVLARKGLSQ